MAAAKLPSTFTIIRFASISLMLSNWKRRFDHCSQRKRREHSMLTRESKAVSIVKSRKRPRGRRLLETTVLPMRRERRRPNSWIRRISRGETRTSGEVMKIASFVHFSTSTGERTRDKPTKYAMIWPVSGLMKMPFRRPAGALEPEEITGIPEMLDQVRFMYLV